MSADWVACAPGVLDTIRAHACREAPRECCGLLIGRAGRIDEAVPTDNRAADPLRRYEIDPADYIAAHKRGRDISSAHRREVVGAYHSHPHSKPEPSPSDLADAFPHFLFLIAGPVAGSLPVEIRAYRLIDGNFRPIRLVPDPEEPQT